MEHEDSVILRAVMDRANARIMSGETTQAAMAENGEMDNIVAEVFLSSPDLLPAYVREITKRVTKATAARRAHDLKIRKNISKRFWNHIRSFKEILAVAEVANRIQLDGMVDWWSVDFEKKFVPPFPDVDITGGVGAKCLLLNSLEARAIVVTQEILELLSLGLSEAARSRARTLHEITTIVATLAIGSKNADHYALSDRYHLSSLIEHRKMNPTTSEYRELMQKARESWGRDFFDQYGWARPILELRPGERPTFAHVERYVAMNMHRHLYVEFNDSIHAGALNVVNRTDFRLKYPHFTRVDCDLVSIRRVLQAALRYLELCTCAAIREVSFETNNWDNGVLIGIIAKMVDPLYESLDGRGSDS